MRRWFGRARTGSQDVYGAQAATVAAERMPAVRRFALHAIEMVVAMLAGMMLLAAVWDLLWPGLADRPAADAVVMGIDMAAGMAFWMWLRGHSGRLVAEMSVAMVAPFVVFLIPYWLGLISSDGLMAFGHIGMGVAMFGAMVLRFHAYAHVHQWRLPVRRARAAMTVPPSPAAYLPSATINSRPEQAPVAGA